MSVLSVFLVGIGGAIGAMLRYFFSKKWNGERFPFGTLFVNVTGSLLLGMLLGVSVPEEWLLFAGTGLLGAFTTFSTFQLESFGIVKERQKKRYFLYQLISYTGGAASAFIGLFIGKILS